MPNQPTAPISPRPLRPEPNKTVVVPNSEPSQRPPRPVPNPPKKIPKSL